MSNLQIAFLLTLLAGLSTGIGSLLAFFTKSTNKKFLSFSLGLSAGVMIYISFIEILPMASEHLASHGKKMGELFTTLAFFFGMGFIALIDKLIPEAENPHEVHTQEAMDKKPPKDLKTLKKASLFTAIAIGIHNFPEGMATFMTALENPTLGFPIAIAIAIHNIPEGISVSVPFFYATGDRKRAFLYSFLSGLAEPVGALVGYFFLRNYLTPSVMGILFGSIAGIMVFISLDELLPAAREYGEHHISIYGVVVGMAVMAMSLIFI